jgi:hypothetical protein
VDALAVDQGTTDELLGTFVGPRASYYLYNWRPALLGHRRLAGWSWPAFLFAGFWFGYRKMYAALAALGSVIVLEAIVVEILLPRFFHLDQPPAAFDATIVVYAIACGALGNRWYLARARAAIAETRERGLHGNGAHAFLAKKGGTSVLVGFLGVTVLALVLYALETLLDGPGT